MEQENRRAAQRAHDNVGRPDDDYDDEGRPAAARAREHAAPEEGERPSGTDDETSEEG